MRIFYLKVSSFTYIGSIGAEHFYGKLICERNKVDITYNLSQRQAAYLNKKDGLSFGRYKKGDLSDRFDSEKEVISAGIKLFNKIKEEKDILLLGDPCIGSIQNILVWPKSFEKQAARIKKLFNLNKKCGGYEGNPTLAAKIDREFSFLLEFY